MKKRITLALILLLAFSLCACGHSHTWKDATCTEPKTCTECGATEGEPAGHTWKEATCTEPKTCTECGATEGEPAGHTWKEATCTEPRTCTGCGATEGEPIDHTWKEATCTEPRTCSVCGATEGEPLGHTCDKWKVVEKATCSKHGSETGVCTVCGETITRETDLAEHTPGDWEVKKKATISADGTKVRKCKVCGKELESETYKLGSFDISRIKSRSNFKYDDFNKSWKYYSTYDKQYSDATESVIIILFSEDNGTNLEDAEIRAGLNWKDAAQKQWVVKSLEVLIDGTIYHFDMTKNDSGSMSYSFLYNDTSYQFIKALANASRIKIKINYDNNQSSDLDVGSNPFRNFCKDIVDYNIWDYYIPSSWLEAADTTKVR